MNMQPPSAPTTCFDCAKDGIVNFASWPCRETIPSSKFVFLSLARASVSRFRSSLGSLSFHFGFRGLECPCLRPLLWRQHFQPRQEISANLITPPSTGSACFRSCRHQPQLMWFPSSTTPVRSGVWVHSLVGQGAVAEVLSRVPVLLWQLCCSRNSNPDAKLLMDKFVLDWSFVVSLSETHWSSRASWRILHNLTGASGFRAMVVSGSGYSTSRTPLPISTDTLHDPCKVSEFSPALAE